MANDVFNKPGIPYPAWGEYPSWMVKDDTERDAIDTNQIPAGSSVYIYGDGETDQGSVYIWDGTDWVEQPQGGQ